MHTILHEQLLGEWSTRYPIRSDALRMGTPGGGMFGRKQPRPHIMAELQRRAAVESDTALAEFKNEILTFTLKHTRGTSSIAHESAHTPAPSPPKTLRGEAMSLEDILASPDSPLSMDEGTVTRTPSPVWQQYASRGSPKSCAPRALFQGSHWPTGH